MCSHTEQLDEEGVCIERGWQLCKRDSSPEKSRQTNAFSSWEGERPAASLMVPEMNLRGETRWSKKTRDSSAQGGNRVWHRQRPPVSSSSSSSSQDSSISRFLSIPPNQGKWQQPHVVFRKVEHPITTLAALCNLLGERLRRCEDGLGLLASGAAGPNPPGVVPVYRGWEPTSAANNLHLDKCCLCSTYIRK